MEDQAPVETPEDVPVAIPGDGPTSVRDAARALAKVRWEQPKQPNPEPSPLMAEVAQAESGEQPVDAAPETEPGEQPQAVEPAEELPPIDPPRSWSKEWKEEFQNYPRELQEKVAAREQERETALRRGQNEAAEQRKALEAQLAQAEQTRRQNESLYPQLLAMLQQQQMGEFSDIQTMADVEKMAREDWPRFSLFQAHQMKLQQVQQLAQAAQERQQHEYQNQWSKFSNDEDAKFIERAPEMANAETATKVRDASLSLLKDIGFSDDDLARLWNGQASLSLRDHRAQLLIRDAVRYREAKAAVPKAAARSVPKVQKPGSPAQRVPDAAVREKQLYQTLDETRGLNQLRVAAQLLSERRAARQR